MSGKVKVWGNMVTVEWADPMEDPDPEVMAKVGVHMLMLHLSGGRVGQRRVNVGYGL